MRNGYAVLCVAALTACGGKSDGRDDATASSTGVLTASATATTTAGTDTTSGSTSTGSATSGTTSGGTTSGGSTGVATATAGTDTGPKFDLGILPDSPMPDSGCTKVDFLFVIDNSGSMSSSQANLLANFPAFINGIQNTLVDVNQYQVGIVSTDKYEYNDPACQDLSSLVIQTGGNNSSMSVCGPYADGFNYMTETDDLAVKFNCAAQLGTQGGGLELPMMALEETVSKVVGGQGQCNEGFLRDDSLWVIVIITDEADGADDPESIYPNPQMGPSVSPGDPTSWFNTVVAARSGEEANAVILSLINWGEAGLDPCPPNSDFFDGKNIKTFTEMFTYGFVGGICEPDYAPYFTQATDVIQDACDNFKPPK